MPQRPVREAPRTDGVVGDLPHALRLRYSLCSGSWWGPLTN